METKIHVRVQGATPLLMNRFRQASIEDKSKKRTGVIHDSPVADKLYLDAKGKPYIPGTYFRSALVEAGKNFKISGRGKSNFSKLIGSTVMVEPECISLKGEYAPYSIAAVNPMTKGRMMVTRPRFEQWECEFDLLLPDEGIDFESMKKILDYAGAYTGIGDWRPQKKGMFGKFIVTEYKQIK